MIKTLQEICQRHVSDAVQQLNQKFQPNLYVNRLEAERLFDRFLRSDKKLFLVLGESGCGKTNLICHLAQVCASRQPAIFISGMWNWPRDRTMWEYLLKAIQIEMKNSEMPFDNWFAVLRNALKENNQEIMIFIDGINETDDQEQVKKGLRMALETESRWVRFVLSSRVDSFRLHYRDLFWKDHLFQDSSTDSSAISAVNVEVQLEASIPEHVRRLVSPEEKKKLEAAIARYQQEIIRKKQELSRSLALDASILLGNFNEIEFNEAMRKYGIIATLMGEAWNTCHDPLMFRFLADTEGKKDLEISEIFTPDTCQNYLNLRIVETENRPPDPSQDEIYKFLYRLARICRAERSHYGHSFRKETKSAQNKRESQLIDSLVESGLLIWRQQVGQERRLNFSFDRILSYILALERYNAGIESVTKRLAKIVKRNAPNEIDIHEANYLLLFLDLQQGMNTEPDAGGKSEQPVKYWVARCLDHPSLRSQVIGLLPDLKSLSIDEAFAKLEHALMGRLPNPWEYQADQNNPMHACATALTKLTQRGHATRVLSVIQRVLSGVDRHSRKEFFYPLVVPVASAFATVPDSAMPLLEKLCKLELELSREYSRFSGLERRDVLSYARRIENESYGLGLLRREVENFPNARLSLVLALSQSPHPIFRAVSIFALAGLAVSNPGEMKNLLQRLAGDGNNLVRASLSTALPFIAVYDETTSLHLATQLWDDKDSDVRSALAQAAIDFCLIGIPQANSLVKVLVYDPSSKVRAAFAMYVVGVYESASDRPDSAKELLKQLLLILASDLTNEVRIHLIQAIFASASFDIFFALEILERTLRGNVSSVLKETLAPIIADVDFKRFDLQKAGDLPFRIASAFTSDPDEEIRASAIPLAQNFAEAGADQCDELLKELLQDPNLEVRLQVLARLEASPNSVLSRIVAKMDAEPLTLLKESGARMRTWIVRFTDARVASLDLRGKINRLFALLSASALILPILLAFGFSGWNHNWLGMNLTGAALVDPRNSAMAMLLGVITAVLLYFIQRVMDFHFYSHYSTVFFRSQWLALSFPFFLGIIGTLGVSTVASWRSALLSGMVCLCAGILFIVPGISSASFEFAWVICAGLIAGAFSGLIGTYTLVDLYYPVCLLLCPLLLSFPIAAETHRRIAGWMSVGLLLTLLAIIVPALNSWLALNNSKINQHLNSWWGDYNVAVPLLAATLTFIAFMTTYAYSAVEEEVFLVGLLLGAAVLILATLFNLHKPTALHIALLIAVVPLLLSSLDDTDWLVYALAGAVGSYWLTALRSDVGSALWIVPVIALSIAGVLGLLINLDGSHLSIVQKKGTIAISVSFLAAPLLYWIAEFATRLWVHLHPSLAETVWPTWGPLVAGVILSAVLVSIPVIFTANWHQLRWAALGAALLNFAILLGCYLTNRSFTIPLAAMIVPFSIWLLSLWFFRRDPTNLSLLMAAVFLPAIMVGISIWSRSKYVGYFALFALVLGIVEMHHRLTPAFTLSALPESPALPNRLYPFKR